MNCADITNGLREICRTEDLSDNFDSMALSRVHELGVKLNVLLGWLVIDPVGSCPSAQCMLLDKKVNLGTEVRSINIELEQSVTLYWRKY